MNGKILRGKEFLLEGRTLVFFNGIHNWKLIPCMDDETKKVVAIVGVKNGDYEKKRFFEDIFQLENILESLLLDESKMIKVF